MVSVVLRMTEVTLCQAQLVLRWMTVCGWAYHLGM